MVRERGLDYDSSIEAFLRGRCRVAVTGAGISVGCGIPDFRSAGGLWARFDPDEYATLDAFKRDPGKAWTFYRALGSAIEDRSEGAAHRSLVQLEEAELLNWVITQNIDNLHRKARTRNLVEVHGDARHLQCLRCDRIEPLHAGVLHGREIPICLQCGEPLKPNVVLFGENIRSPDLIEAIVAGCDVMLLIGTSGQVFPVSAFPRQVASRGGVLIEFNLEETFLTQLCDFHFTGCVDRTLPWFVEKVLAAADSAGDP